MKLNHLISMLLMSFIISSTLISCKKNNAEPKPVCKIDGIITATTVTSFTYNAAGKVSTQTDATGTKEFKYAGNSIIITNKTGSRVNTITTVSLNANGLASSAIATDSAGQLLTGTFYTYIGTELNRSIVSTASGGLDTTTYAWNGGNMVLIDFGASILKLNYSTDKNAQTGDIEDIGNLIQGYLTNRSKNLVTSQDFNGNISIFNYTIDQDGKITGHNTIGNGTAFSFNYLYDCN